MDGLLIHWGRIARLGTDTQASLLGARSGAAGHDWRGSGDTGILTSEGPDRTGMHMREATR